MLSLIELPTIDLSTLYHDFTADLYGTREAWKKKLVLVRLHLGSMEETREETSQLPSLLFLLVDSSVARSTSLRRVWQELCGWLQALKEQSR